MTETLPIVVGVAGRMGSGKTAIARRIQRDFGFQYLRYSEVLAEWFEHDPDDKSRLQDAGTGVMFGLDGQAELNRRLIARVEPRRDVVVDGLRHPIDYESLQAEFGSRFSLVFVDAPEDVRFRRLVDRFHTHEEFLKADSRPVESHIDSLRSLASVILPGDLSPERTMVALDGLILDLREKRVA